MFERFLAFLQELSAGETTAGRPRADDPAVAAAALLFHIMDADGVRSREERAVIEREIAESFSVDAETLSSILSAGEAAERESVDFYAFTRVLMNALDAGQRVEFIGMMWEIVYADGVRDEVEDNIVWRVAELLGVDRTDRIRMRQEVAGRMTGDAKDDAATD